MSNCNDGALQELLELPNGWHVNAASELEAKFIYHEIFGKEQTYMQHGIKICDNDVVMDIGANVGMPGLICCHEIAMCENLSSQSSDLMLCQ